MASYPLYCCSVERNGQGRKFNGVLSVNHVIIVMLGLSPATGAVAIARTLNLMVDFSIGYFIHSFLFIFLICGGCEYVHIHT